MTGRRLRCSAPGLWDNLSRSTAGLGSSPTSIFAGSAPCKNFGVWPHPNCLPKRATRNMAQKNGGLCSLHFLRFLGGFHRLDGGLHNLQFLFVQRVQHGINPFPALAPPVLGRVKILIHGYIKHRDHLIKRIKAGVLAVILVIHNRARSAVNNISQLLLCHPSGFPLFFDLFAYGMKIKPSFVLLYFHNIT